MSTLRELTAESIGRITRRGLELQIAQTDEALHAGEKVVAVAPGSEGSTGLLVTLTDRRLLLSAAAPFARPTLREVAVARITSATAAAEGATWTLRVEPAGEEAMVVAGMFDRDAQRIAALLSAG